MTELEKYRYRDLRKLESFAVKEDEKKDIHPEVPQSYGGWRTMQVGEYWKGRDLYLWIHKDIQVPSEWKGKRILGIFDFGNTGAGNNSGFEAMCYYNGSMYQGVDSNHKEVFFQPGEEGRTVNLTFRLWSGLEGGGTPCDQEHRIQRADLAWLDEKTDDLYYTGSLILDTLANLADGDPVKYDLRNALDDACLCIDWSEPGSDAFYESVHQASELLNRRIDGMEKHSLVNVSCVGHTHIDLAWLWRTKHTREKASRSFSTVLRLMDMYPEYFFLQTQPQVYSWVKSDFPELYEQIKKRIAEGRWEVDGAMWVEADCNLTSGESLTRQILLGSKFIKEEFGKEVEYLWLPDVFGYSWALPQILKKSGIDVFMTTKISWNQYNRMPHDTFKWKGIDGTEILTHFITTPDPWNEPGSWFYTYNGKLTAKTVKGVWEAYSEKELNKELLISYGYGDGGGGVNRDMLENRRRIDRMPGLPNLKTSTASAYFQNLKKTFAETDRYVHTWDGELYLEYHRGTYTSQAYNKRMNRKMELLYRRAEMLGVFASLYAKNADTAGRERLTEGWQLILLNQFHDIIPGSSINDVYKDCHGEYEHIEALAEGVEADAASVIASPKLGEYSIFNASSWTLSGMAALPVTETGSYMDAEGRELKSQRAGDLTYVELKSLPAAGFSPVFFRVGAEKQQISAFTVKDREIETPFYIMELNQQGQIERLYDKEFEREVLPPKARANVLQLFEDKPLDNDAWDIDIFYQQKMKEITNLTKFSVEEQGALRLRIDMEWKFQSSIIRQSLILYSESRRIDFETYVDYKERQQLLKAAFPVDVRTTFATYDIQYGNVRRPNHWNTRWDQARFETVGHRFADLSEREYGVALLNDCKYGYDVKDNVLRLSLLRSGLQPDHLQDMGEHYFTYSLLPHGGDFVAGKVVQEAYVLNNPFKVIEGNVGSSFKSLVSFDNEHVELDAVKQSEDGSAIVLRIHEFSGTRTRVRLNAGFELESWTECDLRERPLSQPSAQQDIVLELHPYEVKSLLLVPKAYR